MPCPPIVDQYDTWNVAAVQDAMTQLQEGATVFSNRLDEELRAQ
ncbi:MAG: hypothetical protein ACLU3I_04605 [Acutalibacteraceae bacterium]